MMLHRVSIRFILILLVLSSLIQCAYAPKGDRLCDHTKRMIIYHIRRGADVKSIAFWMGISVRVIYDYKKKILNGQSLRYKPRSGGPKPKWNNTHTRIAAIVFKENACVYIGELRKIIFNITGDKFGISTIWRNMKLNNLSNKVIQRRFAESNPRVELAFWYSLTANNIHINQLIWFDESYICRLNGNRKRGWSVV